MPCEGVAVPDGTMSRKPTVSLWMSTPPPTMPLILSRLLEVEPNTIASFKATASKCRTESQQTCR